MVIQANQQPIVTIRSLTENDLVVADRVLRLAFGTFLGYPDPANFWADTAYIRPRWKADPSSVFGAEYKGELAGTNVANNWGSVGFLGPLTIHPHLWNKKIGQQLMEPVLARFDTWNTRNIGLCTFPQSGKHVYFYQKFGFWPRFLTMILTKLLVAQRQLHEMPPFKWVTYSSLSQTEREYYLTASYELTDSLYIGLDLQKEIISIGEQKLGDTIFLYNESTLLGFALCHYGKGTEATTNACHIKFAAVRSGPRAEQQFDHLLYACEAFAIQHRLFHLTAGVNTARHEAYCQLLANNFKVTLQCIVMQRDNVPGYNHPGVYIIDDWR